MVVILLLILSNLSFFRKIAAHFQARLRATTSSSTPASRPGFNLTSLFIFGTDGENKNAGVFVPGNGANVMKTFYRSNLLPFHGNTVIVCYCLGNYCGMAVNYHSILTLEHKRGNLTM